MAGTNPTKMIHRCGNTSRHIECNNFFSNNKNEMLEHFMSTHINASNTCDICKLSFNEFHDLLTHLMETHINSLPEFEPSLDNNHNKRTYLCKNANHNQECNNFLGNDITDTFEHIMSVHISTSNSCNICKSPPFNETNDLVNHVLEMHTTNFVSLESLLPNHNFKRTFCCDDWHCDITTNDFDLWFAHLSDAHIKTPKGEQNICDMCNHECGAFEDLLMHFIDNHLQEYFHCPICDIYLNMETLSKHLSEEFGWANPN